MAQSVVNMVDQLADVRAEIRALRAVEEELRMALLARPGRVQGARFVALSEAKRTRRFDPKLLPQLTYQDPRFWSTQITKVVRVFARDEARPEGRARRDAAMGFACDAGVPHPPQGAVRHSVPPVVEDLGPEMYRMADDFWDRL